MAYDTYIDNLVVTGAEAGAIPVTAAIHSEKTRGIVRAIKDSSSTSTNFVLTAEGITELYDGLLIIVKNDSTASASGWVINLNNLGGKPVHNSKTNNRITTAFEANSEYMFIFDAANDRWVMYLGYFETNSNTIGEYRGSVTIDENGYNGGRYGLFMMTQENPPRVSCVVTTTTTNTKTKCPLGFIPNDFMSYVPGSTSAVPGGTTDNDTHFITWPTFSLRYSWNISTSTLPTDTPGKGAYFKGTINANDGKFYLADTTWWAVDLPTTNDGYYYWYIGQMHSRYQCTLAPHHPIYYHDGISIREYVPDETQRCYEEKTGSIVTIDTNEALQAPISKFIIDIDSQDGCTEANILHTGKNLCGGEDLCNTIEAGVTTSTIDETNGTISFAASTTALGPMATGIYKEKTRYTFIFTIYKSKGESANLKINYSDGTSYAWGGFEVGAKKTLAYTTPAGKTVTGLTKYNSSGTTTLYYNESGIFEGVLTAEEFTEYFGAINTIDFNGNTVHTGTLDVLNGKLTIMDSEPYTTIDVTPISYQIDYSYDDVNNYIIDCGNTAIDYVIRTQATEYIESRLTQSISPKSIQWVDYMSLTDINFLALQTGPSTYDDTHIMATTANDHYDLLTIHGNDSSLEAGSQLIKATNKWTLIDDTGYETQDTYNIVPISNYTNYSEFMIQVCVTNVSGTDCYKETHIIPANESGMSPSPSARQNIFGGYYYSTSYFLNYALECEVSNGTYNISWRTTWFTMKPTPTSNNEYRIMVYAR